MFNDRKQGGKAFKILFCFFANFICFGVCYYCRLPVRMEHVGSLYAVAAIGFVPSVFIALGSQLIYSLFYFGFSNIVMLLPIIAVLVLILFAEQFGWLDTIISSTGVMTVSGMVYTVLMIPLSIWVGRGFLTQTCWISIYNLLGKNLLYHPLSASCIAVAPYCFLNIVCSWIVMMIAYRLTPKPSEMSFSDTFAKKRLQNRK